MIQQSNTIAFVGNGRRDLVAMVLSAEEFEKALPLSSKRDVPNLYAAGNAWLGWILSQPDSMAALTDLSKALAQTQRVLDLDESYANGGAHLVFGIYAQQKQL